jgi:beta-1,3-galactosyltransferase 1
LVLEEAQEHNDIIIEDFNDVYLNLTLKTGFLLKWLAKDCRDTKFVFKVDDDVFVNTEKLWETLESSHLYSTSMTVEDADGKPFTSNLDYAVIGHVMHTVPIREQTSKWYLPVSFYPLNIFPKFTSGTAYIFTGSLVPSFLRCALKTPFINLEDVFLTGLCASTQLGLHLTHNPSFVWRPMVVGGSHTCYYKQSVTVHGSSPEHMEKVFALTQDHHLCDSILFSAMGGASAVIDFVRNIFRV